MAEGGRLSDGKPVRHRERPHEREGSHTQGRLRAGAVRYGKALRFRGAGLSRRDRIRLQARRVVRGRSRDRGRPGHAFPAGSGAGGKAPSGQKALRGGRKQGHPEPA